MHVCFDIVSGNLTSHQVEACLLAIRDGAKGSPAYASAIRYVRLFIPCFLHAHSNSWSSKSENRPMLPKVICLAQMQKSILKEKQAEGLTPPKHENSQTPKVSTVAKNFVILICAVCPSKDFHRTAMTPLPGRRSQLTTCYGAKSYGQARPEEKSSIKVEWEIPSEE